MANRELKTSELRRYPVERLRALERLVRAEINELNHLANMKTKLAKRIEYVIIEKGLSDAERAVLEEAL